VPGAHAGLLNSDRDAVKGRSNKRPCLSDFTTTVLHPELKRRHFIGRELKRSLYRRLLALPEAQLPDIQNTGSHAMNQSVAAI
jgi:hypothetical protein